MALDRPAKKAEADYQLTDLITLLEENKMDDFFNVIHRESNGGGPYSSWYRSTKEIEHLVDVATLKAIELKNTAAVKILFDHGIYQNKRIYENPMTEKGSWMPLIWYAVKAGSLDIVKFLVERKAEIKRGYDSGDDSAIREAVKSNQTEIAAFLLESGADANIAFRNVLGGGTTLLAKAAENQNLPMVKLIAQHTGVEGVLSAISQIYDETYERTNNIKRALEDKYFDAEKKPELKEKLEKYNRKYKLIVNTLMDHAAGLDLPETIYIKESYFDNNKKSPLHLFNLIDTIADINFIGVSIAGKPVTRDMLKAAKLPRADKALVTTNDLAKLSDVTRQSTLSARIHDSINSQGGVHDKAGYINLAPLWSAAKHGDLQTVNARLKAGVNPNETSKGNYYSKYTPLIEAASKGHTEICQLLLEHDIDEKTIPLALDAANKAGHTALAELLHNHQHVDQVDQTGETLLHRAVREGNVTEVEKLIARGADTNHKGKGNYPLTLAASNIYNRNIYSGKQGPSKEHLAIIKLLLNAGADPDLRSYKTAMEIAGESGSLEGLKLLAPVTTKHDITPPEYHVNHGKLFPWYTDIIYDSYQSYEWLDILKYLKDEFQIDLNQPDNGRENKNLLHTVVIHFPNAGDISHAIYETKRYWGGYPVDDRVRKDIRDTTRRVKHNAYATFLAQMERLDWLLDNGISPIYKDNQGTALLDFVASSFPSHVPNSYPKILDKLIAKGTDINFVDKNTGNTALLVAAKEGSVAAVKCLLARGADANARDNDGRTALFYAAGAGFPGSYPTMVRALIQYGADTTISDYSRLSITDFTNTERQKHMENELNYKKWDRSQQNEWQAKFDKTYAYLRDAQNIRNKVLTTVGVEKLSAKVSLYAKPNLNPLIETVHLRDIKPAEDRLLDVFRDMVTGEIMRVPVKLFETVYDLDTLLALPENNRRHPATGKPFTLSDIKPAKEMLEMMKEYSDYLLEKHPEPSVKKQRSVVQQKSIFSRWFGGSKTTDDTNNKNEMKVSNSHR